MPARSTSREAFFTAAVEAVRATGAAGGEGLRILTGYVGSPTLSAQLDRLLQRYPNARRHCWEPLHRDRSMEGAQRAFGRALSPVYHFDRADVVLSLDADFLGEGPGHLRYARDYASLRRGVGERRTLNRLYVVESSPTLAGAVADHRFARAPAEVERWLAGLAAALRGEGGGAEAAIAAVAKDLRAHRGRALVVPGEALPPDAHALVHAINAGLGAPGATVDYIEPVTGDWRCGESMRSLVEDMRAGKVRALFILGGNPAYDAPADLGFGEALAHVPYSAHLSLGYDETSAAARWHAPGTHFLEHWSDARAYDGTASIVQPAIAPLHGGISPHELLGELLDEPTLGAREAVRRQWRPSRAAAFEDAWHDALATGVVAGTAASAVAAHPRTVRFEPPAQAPAWSVRLTPDPATRDGEFANNAWLQEIPRSHSKLTWDNAAHLSPASAAKLGLAPADVIEITANGRAVRAPIWVLPGHPDGSITLALGYGRTRAGSVGSRVGVDAYPLRTLADPWSAPAAVRKVAGSHYFATTQNHARMEGREPVRRATLAELVAGQAHVRKEKPPGSIYPPWKYEGYKWGMSIDLNACIGCNACTIACQAENNIPSVGKRQVAHGREMHWIRIDRYFEGDEGRPRIHFQPIPCMQCETAPCEVVCPVGATMHDSEGINVQVYNRCVGTRFCSNNCPYKVRRFNFLQYSRLDSPSMRALANPEVTTRLRGVMEKCNYCLQRITRARIETEKEGRAIRDGEVVTACQAVCPTRAISFGDMNDPASEVSARKASPLDYALLGELNLYPRTTYLARILNPNPDIEEA